MKLEPWLEDFPEPERYELHAGPAYQFDLSRREFLHTLGVGILISMSGSVLMAQRTDQLPGGSDKSRLHVDGAGLITVMTTKVEVGQGSRTQLTQAAAEELRVPLAQIRLVMADTALGPDDGGTAGSRTTPSSVPTIRKACAAARKLLLNAAATKFKCDPAVLTVKEGMATSPDAKERFGYGDLAKMEDFAQALGREAAAGIEVARVTEWKVLGTPVPKVGAEAIVKGEHRYPSDIKRPGMLFGKVLRAPSYGAKLSSVDVVPAQAMPGVVAVRDGDFVGVAAASSFRARQALAAIGDKAEWERSPHPSSAELYEHLRQHPSTARGRSGRSGGGTKGSFKEGIESAKKVLRASFNIAFIQHAPLEPRAAVAEWTDGALTVWTGTQQPGRVRQELSQAFKVAPEKVRVVVPDTGGGFGGKHSGEAAVEAARLALAAKRPVSLQWTREEEFTWAYFRPAGIIDLVGGLDEAGGLVAWEQVNLNSGASALATPYDIPNQRSEFKACQSPLREGSYRALASTANVFARESFMDELCSAAGGDPLEFRRRHLAESRLRAVLESAAKQFGWAARREKSAASGRRGVGLACGTEKGSYVAACVEIEVDRASGRFKVLEVCEAFECGAIQNPANLKNQVEGCIIQGLGGALTEEMRFQDGRISNPRFSGYSVPRFRDVPHIETILLNRPDLASIGAGETPIVAIAPAIANALAAATGTRIRSLPIRNETYRVA